MMSPERFTTERAADWSELDAALRRCGDRPERLGHEGVRRMGALYRAAAADLAFARASWPSDPVVRQLEALVLRGRAAVYGRAGRRASARAFFSRGYWVRLAERPWILFIAWALLLAPALLGYAWARLDPAAAAGLVPAEFQGAANPPTAGRDFNAATSSAFAVDVMTNNIQVTLLAFAGGITFGALTVWSLFFNGLLLGVVGGLAIGAGNGIAFLRLISSHGPLELSCIVVGGVAGLRMGWALIRPGPVRRTTSLRQAAVPAVELAVGTAPWLVLCGFCEGFLTGPELPVALQTAIGLSLFALFWGLVWIRGWRGASRADTRRRARPAAGPAGLGAPVPPRP